MLPVQCENIQTMIKELAIHDIVVIDSFAKEFQKTVKKKQNNSIEFLVNMGYFAASISLLKVHKESSTFDREKLAEGTFSNIFFQRFGKKEFAVKSQKLRVKDRLAYNSSLDSIIKEYFFFKIASVLGFGPRMDNIFGYDLSCYRNRI